MSRLAAVQALYQRSINPDLSIADLIAEYRAHRLGKVIDDVPMADADGEFFAQIVNGVYADRDRIDALIAAALSEKWSEDRLEAVIRAILRAGCFELLARPDVPTAVVINEYLDVAHAFFEGREVGFINGVLDRISAEVRS